MHKIVVARPMPKRVEICAQQSFDVYQVDRTFTPEDASEALRQHETEGLLLGSDLKMYATDPLPRHSTAHRRSTRSNFIE